MASLALAGPFAFGLVIGWVTYRTLRRREDAAALTDIATVLGAVGGAAVTGLFKDGLGFHAYSIGLAAGFFGYLAASWAIYGKKEVGRFMGD